MITKRALGAALLLALIGATPATAQILNPVTPLDTGAPVNASNPLHVTGSFSASFAGFPTVQTTGTPIAVTSSAGGVSGTLPSGTVVVATNVGTTNAAYCKLGASASTSDQYIAPSGGWFAFTVGANTQLTCITSTSTTTVNMVGGSGLPTGTGGGSGGGGGGGTVTQGNAGTNAQAWWVEIGDTTNGPAAVVTAGADAVSNTQSGLAGYTRMEAYNGTTWDRVRTGTTTGSVLINGAGTAGTASGGVVTVQGVASGTNLNVSQATAGNLNATVVGTGTFAVQATLQASATTAIGKVDPNTSTSWGLGADTATFTAGTSVGVSMNGEFTSGGATACVTGHICAVGITSARGLLTDVSTINGTTVLVNTGAVGAGAQRVAVGTDTATIAGSAPGTAGAASANVVTVQGVASMTPILANPGTAANWGVQTQGSTTSGQSGTLIQGAVTTAAPTYSTTQTSPISLDTSGNIRVNCTTGCSSSGGSSLADEGTYTQGSTSFTVAGGFYNTSPVNLSSGQAGAFLATADRLQKITQGLTTSTLTGWTSATTSNSTQNLMVNGNTGVGAILLQLDQTSTISGGAITIEGTYDGTNFVTIPVTQILNPNTFAQLTNPYTLTQSTNQPFLIMTMGYQQVRIRLSTTITGTATVTPFVALISSGAINWVANALPAVANTSSGISTSSGCCSPVVNYNYAYNGTTWDQVQADSAKNVKVVLGGGTPISASATGTTAATTATLAGTSGKTTYICGMSIRANATAAATVNATVTGTITGTLNFTQWVAPLASGLGVLEETFTPCLAASGTNTGIAVISGAAGSGGVTSSTAWGYQQ